ncbi:MAG: hypothetical protein AB7J32_13905 [Pseudonocardia sp.]
MDRRTRKLSTRRLPVLVAALGVSLSLCSTLSGVAAADDYARQNRVTYQLKDGYGHPNPKCTGEAWIGQTRSNSIQAISRVTCGTARPLTNQTETAIAPGPGLTKPLASKKESCSECSTVIASVSHPGGAPGTQYRVQGFGAIFTPVRGTGGGTACITI